MGQNTNRYVKDFKTDNNGNTTDVRLNTDETFGIQDEDLEERVEYLEQTLASMLTNTGLLRIAKGGTEADNASDALKNLIDGLQSISQITGENYDIIIQRVIGDEDLGKVFAINLADAVLSSIPNPLPINRGGTNAQTVNDIIANVLNTNAVADGAVRDDGVFPYKCDSAYAQGNNIGKISLSQIWDWLHNIKETATLEDVNSITAKYITSSAAGAAFADEAALAGDKYYAGQIITTSTSPALGNNDYCIVLDSGASHNNATARYVYQEGAWVFQYVVSQVTLNQAQLDALNSGITAAKVTKLDNLEEGYAFTYIVDSDVKLANWLNGVPGNDYSSVLVKTGTWNYNGIPLPLDDNSINTKKIIGEYNSVIHISADGDNDDVVGLKNGEYIYNIILSVSNTGTSSAMETYGFVSCDNLTNCSVVIDVNEVNSRVYGYYRCHKLLDCNANTTGVLSVCFDECEELNRCEANADTYETIQGATGSMCFSLCRRLNYCKATANRGSSSPAAIGYYMCYGVTYCKAQSDDRLYQSSYSSLGAVDGYECSNSLNGGFNSNINDTITGFLSPLGQVYAECSTSASTNTKQITATINSSLILVKGLKITVAFTNSNSASAPAISIDGGSTSIRIADEYGNLPASGEAVNLWLSGEIVDFIYDGTYWRIMRKDHNPVGTIIAHANSNAPAGYILCDGRQLATSQYPQLSAACGSTYNTYSGGTPSSGYFRIPDLRETTLVGAGTRGSRVTRHLASSTSGMSAGVFYDDALQGHYHAPLSTNTTNRAIATNYGTGGAADLYSGGGIANWAKSTGEEITDGTHGTPRIDYTTHGKIMAIYYYIKYF